MPEDKVPAEILGLGNSSSGEGSFAFDSQLVNLEEHMKKAQTTLIELQLLKEKLEQERSINLEKAKIEKERKSLEHLKEENKKLKTELHDYQEEIDGLRDVIGSLKSDLATSAEQFQSQFENSLKLLKKVDKSLKAKDPFSAIERMQEKSEELKQLQEKAMLDLKTNETVQPILSNAHNETPLVQEVPKVPETPETQNHEPSQEEKREPQTVTPIEEKVEPPSTTSGTEAAPPQSEEKKPEEVNTGTETDGAIKPLEVSQEENNEEGTESLLGTLQATIEKQEKEKEEEIELQLSEEYDRIKKELEALEQDPIVLLGQTPAVIGQAFDPPQAKKGLPSLPKLDFGKLLSIGNRLKKTKVTPDEETNKLEVKQEEFLTVKKAEEVPPAQKEEKQEIPKTEAVEEIKPVITEQPKEVEEKTKKFLFFFKRKPKEKKDSLKEERGDEGKQSGGVTGILVKTVTVFLILLTGITAYRLSKAEQLREVYTSQVKGAYESNAATVEDEYTPEEFRKQPPEQKYKEAYADIPFDQTVWATHKEAQLKIDYPKNSTFRLRPHDSNNLWFLRKDGYLLKIEKIKTPVTPEEYLKSAKQGVEYKTEPSNISGFTAIKMTPMEDLPIPGITYLVKVNQDIILKIWHKTFIVGSNPDDEQRVDKMMQSLELYKVKSTED